MTQSGFNPRIRYITDGEPVAAAITNRPTSDIANYLDEIYRLLQATGIGGGIFATRVTADASVVVGSPVYLDNGIFMPSKQALAIDLDGKTVSADSSRIDGIVTRKHNATLVDVLLAGAHTFDISPATEEPPTPGMYYLSATRPGKITKSRQQFPVPVCVVGTKNRVYRVPTSAEPLLAHTHSKIELVCLPAGVHIPPQPNERHIITDANTNLPGWLPINDPIFAGKNIPTGAKFGYNISADIHAKTVWPYSLFSGAYLEWDRAEQNDRGFTGVPSGFFTINEDGIWWLTDCYGDVPWPKNYNSLPASDSNSNSNSYYESDSENIHCDEPRPMAMRLWLTSTRTSGTDASVRSLRSKDTRLVIRRCNGLPGETGDLEALLNLSYPIVNTTSGTTALRNFDGNVFTKGPVVTGVYTTASNVFLSGQAQTPLNDQPNAPLVHSGIVRIAVDPAGAVELSPEIVRLDLAAEQSYYDDMPYIRLIQDRNSAVVIRIPVPAGLAIPNPQLRLRVWLFASSAGTLPLLNLVVRKIPRTLTATAMPGDSANAPVAIPTNVPLLANQYIEVESAAVVVNPGDIVLFKIKRTAGDGYAGSVGLVKIAANVSQSN